MVPGKAEPLDALIAIATDLLAQAEAQHRTTTRLEVALRQLTRESRAPRDQANVPPAIEMLRRHVRTLRELFETECALLDELERELGGVTK